MTFLDQNEIKCTQCNGSVVIHQGHYVCSNCGLVLMPEYVPPPYLINPPSGKPFYGRAFVSLGSRPNIVDGLGSYIGYPKAPVFFDTRGNSLTSSTQNQFNRLKQRYSLQTRISTRETDYRVLRILNRVVDLLGLSNNIATRAAYFYKKAISMEDQKAFTNHVLLIAVCLLTAIREYGINAPKTIKEVAACFYDLGHRVSTRHIVREMLKLRIALGLKCPPRKSSDYINRLISQIVTSKKVQLRLRLVGWDPEDYEHRLTKNSFNILQSTPQRKVGGRNPYIFAASTIYTADKIIAKRTQKKTILTQKILAEVTGIAQYSLRDHYCRVLKDVLCVSI